MAVVIRYRTIAERYVVDVRMVEYLRKMADDGATEAQYALRRM